MAARLSKKRKQIQEKLDTAKAYVFADAITALQDVPRAKFKESVDVAVQLGIDPKKSDQVVRGATVLPAGTGKTVKVAVFTQGPNAQAAEAAGADKVGMADLAEDIKAGNCDYDVIIASPDAMGVVGPLGPVLGPRGLMPNPKVGTVAMDVATAVKNAKGGQVRYRTDKYGIIHCSIGKVDFNSKDLQNNLEALLASLRKAKPSNAKGAYFKKLSVATTMGPGLSVDVSSLDVK